MAEFQEFHLEIKAVEEEDWERGALCTSMVHIRMITRLSR